MVAKIPLLMSSRMMSAGFTPSSSASSLTVIVPGSSIAPRSRGSSVWTPPPANVPSLRGGFRGPRRPRVPLLLLATGSSLGSRVGQAPGQRSVQIGRKRGLQRPTEGALLDGEVEAIGRATNVRAATGQPTGLVDDHPAIGRTHDTQQITLRTNRPTGDARAVGDA